MTLIGILIGLTIAACALALVFFVVGQYDQHARKEMEKDLERMRYQRDDAWKSRRKAEDALAYEQQHGRYLNESIDDQNDRLFGKPGGGYERRNYGVDPVFTRFAETPDYMRDKMAPYEDGRYNIRSRLAFDAVRTLAQKMFDDDLFSVRSWRQDVTGTMVHELSVNFIARREPGYISFNEAVQRIAYEPFPKPDDPVTL